MNNFPNRKILQHPQTSVRSARKSASGAHTSGSSLHRSAAVWGLRGGNPRFWLVLLLLCVLALAGALQVVIDFGG